MPLVFKVAIGLSAVIVGAVALAQAIVWTRDQYPQLHRSVHQWWLAAPWQSTFIVASLIGVVAAVAAGSLWRYCAAIPDPETVAANELAAKEAEKKAAAERRVEAILEQVRIVGRLPTNAAVFPALFDIQTDFDLRAISIVFTVDDVVFERGGRIANSRDVIKNHFERIPAGQIGTTTLKLPVDPTRDGKPLPVLMAVIGVALEFSIPGEVGRFGVFGEFRLDGRERLWHLSGRASKRLQ